MSETMLEIDQRLLFDPDHLATLDGGELAELFKRLERLRPRTEGALAAVVGEVRERGVHGGDGHRSVNAWCRALARWSDVECRDRIRTATLIGSCDRFRDAVLAGEIGVAESHGLGRGVGQPQVWVTVGGSRLVDGRQRPASVASRVPHHRAAVGDAG